MYNLEISGVKFRFSRSTVLRIFLCYGMWRKIDGQMSIYISMCVYIHTYQHKLIGEEIECVSEISGTGREGERKRTADRDRDREKRKRQKQECKDR